MAAGISLRHFHSRPAALAQRDDGLFGIEREKPQRVLGLPVPLIFMASLSLGRTRPQTAENPLRRQWKGRHSIRGRTQSARPRRAGVLSLPGAHGRKRNFRI
jgi:hypothetical protein